LALGPAVGDAVLDAAGSSAVWFVSGGLAGLASILGAFTREVPRTERADPGGPLVNRAAVRPGALLFLGLVPLAAFMAFLPLYVEGSNLPGADIVFLLYGALVLVVRIFGARLPDRLGPQRAGVSALAGAALGMVVMAAWASTAGLLLGTVLFAAGMSLQYPALLLMALAGAPETERASVVGTFSSFFDLSQGLGSVIVGGVAAVGGYRGAFGAGALSAGIGLVIVGLRPARRERAVEVAEAGALVAEHPAQ
jgi:predicted MFS family arabinose efflux permease